GIGQVEALRTDFLINSVPLDPAHQRLSEVFRESICRYYTNPMAPAVHSFGVTPEAQQGFRDEMGTADWRLHFTMLLTWTRKAPDA
ncbi:hypothetical protein EVG20_g11579, partial [Dentipellis fragilis]